MSTEPLVDLTTAWLSNPSITNVAIKPRALLAQVLVDQSLFSAFARLLPGFSERPDHAALSRWFAAIEGQPLSSITGSRYRFERSGHGWHLVPLFPSLNDATGTNHDATGTNHDSGPDIHAAA